MIHSFICNDTNIGTAIFFLRSFLKWSTVTNCAYWLCDRKQNIATGPSISVKIRLNCNNWFVFKTFPLLIIILTSCTFYPYNGRSSIELEQHDKKEWALFRILVAHYFQVFNFSIRWYLFSIIDVLLFNILVFFIDSQRIPEITIFGTQTEINSHTKVRNCDRYINCEYQRQTPSTLTTILYLKKNTNKGRMYTVTTLDSFIIICKHKLFIFPFSVFLKYFFLILPLFWMLCPKNQNTIYRW